MKVGLLICFLCSFLALATFGCGSSTSSGKPPDSSKPSESHVLKAQIPSGPPPKKLVIKDLRVGTGPAVKIGGTGTVQYIGVAYKTGKQFDARPRSEPFVFYSGTGGEQPGWEKGVPGMKVGGQRELIIPPRLTLNELGRPETLVYVIELLATSSPTSASSHTSASDETKSTVETGPLKVAPHGSASYRIRGHHTGVPNFGAEANGAELRAAATIAHGYLVARVEKDWPKTCSYVSKDLMRELASQSQKLNGKSCATVLGALTKPGPGGSDYESSEVEAESLRVKGNRAFLLYRAATAPYFMPMAEEDGAWKVASLDPTAFYH